MIKRINKLIKIHNTQVKQGRFHEDAMEYISTAEQLIFLKNTKKRVYEFFEGTEYEDIIKARYRERGNYNYIAYELHMSQGKYYYNAAPFVIDDARRAVVLRDNDRGYRPRRIP